MKRLIFFLVPLMFSTLAASAEEGGLKSKDEVKKLSGEVMQWISDGKVTPALDLLAPHFPVPPNQRMALSNQVSQSRVMLEQRYGKALGYSLAREAEVKDVLLRYEYIEKLERHFTRWVLLFYKPKDRWLFNTISWDDNATDLFED